METLFIGKNIIFLPETESTNSYANLLLKNVNLAEGSVIYTAHQTAGRGQRGNAWSSEPLCNLNVSMVLRPVFLELKNQFFLYQVMALACRDTMAELLQGGQFDIKIKWPNDILVNQRKVAGILIENNIQNNSINWSVAGIGLNVNQEFFPGIPQATSLRILTGKEHSTQRALELLCRHTEKYYLQLKSGRTELIRREYLLNLFGLHQSMTFQVNNVLHTMEVMGVSDQGLLHLKDENGRDIEADVKQLKWIY